MKKSSGSVTIIGAANMDINGFSDAPINMADSNPGTVEYCPGGVGRNIAENLARLEVPIKLITALGDDSWGKLIQADCTAKGIDLGGSLFAEHARSPVYMAVMDSNGEMTLALSDMKILDSLNAEYLDSRADIIKESEILVVETNLTEELIRHITGRFGDQRIFLDPVSGRKAEKITGVLDRLDTLKLGCMEAEFLSGIPIPFHTLASGLQGEAEPGVFRTPPPEALISSLEQTGAFFIRRGVKRIFLTLGKKGVYFQSRDNSFFSPVRYVEPVNTSGGGDAFMAGIVYSSLKGYDDMETVSFAAAMAAVTVQSRTTVSPDMNLRRVRSQMRRE